MIPKRKIKAFLTQPRDDLRTYKKLTLSQLEALKAQLPVQPPIWNKLKIHQKVGFLLGAKYGRIALWLDTGTGKSCLSIALARYFRKLKTIKRCLILVPNNINKYEWKREIKKHSPETSHVILSGSSLQKWDQLRSNQSFLVIATYAGLVRMACKIVKNKKGKNKLAPDPKLVRELAKAFDGLVNDESTSLGSRSSLAFRICRQIGKKAPFVANLSGTPFGRDPTPLWAQMFLIDGGESLGKNLGLFRAAFFTAQENIWSGYPEYTFDKRKKGLLNRCLAHRSIRYEADKADLPPVVSIVKYIRLPSDAKTYYEKAKERLIAAHGNYQEQKNSFLRLRQISSGFLGYKDDERGVKAQVEFNPNPKLEMLLSIIQAAQASYKICVMHDFIFSGTMIARELKKLGIGYARVYGKTKKEAPEQLRKFDEDEDCRVFIINSAGAFGLNLQRAKAMIFFESPVSPMIRTQMERRVERQGSTHNKVFRYDLLTEHTVDQQIRDMHAEGKSLLEAIVNGVIIPK
jgi:SNF2 family DNA or RNA helicase